MPKFLKIFSFFLLFLFIFAFRGSNILSTSWKNIGVLIYQQGPLNTINTESLISAKNYFLQAKTLNPQSPSISRWLGFTFTSLGLEIEAIDTWQPNSKQIYDELIFIANRKRNCNQLNESLLWYDRAIQLEPDIGDPWYYKGLVYEKLSLYENSISSFWMGLDQPQLIGIGESNFYFRIGWTLSRNQEGRIVELSDILNLYDTALDANAFSDEWTRIQTHFARGEVLSKLDRESEAIEEFEFVLSIDKTHYASRVQLGSLIWSEDQDAELAEQLFREAIEINPESKWAYRGLANLFFSTNKHTLAIQMYEKVLEIDPLDNFAILQLARLHDHQQD